MNDTMRSLFFIIKGQYRRGVKPQFVNSVSGDTTYIGGYDPSSPHTEEWYMLLDNKTFHCIACGSDFDRVLRGVYTVIKKHKGVARDYFKRVSDTTSDDYYETHYLGHEPLTHDQRVAKAEGRCPRVSPVMRCLYEEVFKEYGHFYSDKVEEMEDLAYKELRENTPLKRSKKLTSNFKGVGGVDIVTHKVEEKVETPKTTRPKVRLGLSKKKETL